MLTHKKLQANIFDMSVARYNYSVTDQLIRRTNSRVNNKVTGPTCWHEVVSWKNFQQW